MNTTLYILIVDDSDIMQEILSAALKSLGHRGVIVSNGEEALRCLEQRNFDLILLDVNMPVMDGLTTLKLLREKERDNAAAVTRTPVIFITGNDLPSDLETYHTAGADGFIYKPVKFPQLDSEIKRVLGKT